MIPPHVRAAVRELASFLAEWRRFLGISQGDMATRIEVSQPTLSGWEHGKRDVSVSLLLAYAREVGLVVALDMAGPDRGYKPRLPDLPETRLTQRELQVLAGMSQGVSNAQIGRGLGLSQDTVKTHARRMFRKLGANDRAHAVFLGCQLGLLSGLTAMGTSDGGES